MRHRSNVVLVASLLAVAALGGATLTGCAVGVGSSSSDGEASTEPRGAAEGDDTEPGGGNAAASIYVAHDVSQIQTVPAVQSYAAEKGSGSCATGCRPPPNPMAVVRPLGPLGSGRAQTGESNGNGQSSAQRP